ncbi:MAG: hypothetical protein AAGF02_12005 [Actinomycetota bacterium]
MNDSLTAPETALLLTHVASTWFLVGLIWIVQRVTYPAFHLAEGDGTEYHRHHTRGIGPVVGPLMAIEAATAVLLVVVGVPGVPLALALVGLGLLGVVQASTVLLQVPAHDRLSDGMEPDEISSIVRTNWIRTLGWTARGAVALWMLVAAG